MRRSVFNVPRNVIIRVLVAFYAAYNRLTAVFIHTLTERRFVFSVIQCPCVPNIALIVIPN